MDLSTRVDLPELMDTQTFPVDVMRDTLAFLGHTNRYFGGSATVIRHLKKWSKNWGNAQIHILDIGTGGAEVPIDIVQWARRKNLNLKITALDLVPEIAQIA